MVNINLRFLQILSKNRILAKDLLASVETFYEFRIVTFIFFFKKLMKGFVILAKSFINPQL